MITTRDHDALQLDVMSDAIHFDQWGSVQVFGSIRTQRGGVARVLCGWRDPSPVCYRCVMWIPPGLKTRTHLRNRQVVE